MPGPRMDNSQSNLHTLSVEQVANWQVALPALQRGAVWKPQQVEDLWDSLMRGFPIGSFLVSPFSATRGARPLKYARNPPSPDSTTYAHHLLDGQQRSNAIALAFLDSWQSPEEPSPPAVLWLDLAPQKKESDDRQFIFRVTTSSHPWGYERTDPSKRLESAKKREALEAFRKVLPPEQQADCRAGNIDLRYAWPWDAGLPVPFPFLVQAWRLSNSTNSALMDKLRELCRERLPFWDSPEFSAIKRGLTLPNGELNNLVPRIKSAIERLVGSPARYQIPVQTLEMEPAPAIATHGPADAPRIDSIETLFVRVNSRGTRLDGEELNYSILKSIWPESQQLVESLSSRIMPPSRLVMLFTRLILSQHADQAELPSSQTVDQFRRLVHGQNTLHPYFLSELRRLLDTRNQGHAETAAELLSDAQELMTLRDHSSYEFALPPVLVADIARRSTPAFFLLISWISRMKKAGRNPRLLAEEPRRRLIGAITALAWFSPDSEVSVRILWKRLRQTRAIDLPGFFGKDLLQACFTLQRGKIALIPPIPPTTFMNGSKLRLRGLLAGNGNQQAWNTWAWHSHFLEASLNGDPIIPKLASLMRRSNAESHDTSRTEFASLAWMDFAERVWGMRELVIYAQRHWMLRWFPHFDPARPDQLEDTDRPWDIDHIHAQNYTHNIKLGGRRIRIISDWNGSIGNLRVWPFELNRADGDEPPCTKLAWRNEADFRRRYGLYGIASQADLCEASALAPRSLQLWQGMTPEASSLKVNYLRDNHEYCPRVLNTITTRMFFLYRGWYQQLRLRELTGQ